MTEGCNAIAACEVLAAMQGRPSPTLPEDVAAIAKRLSGKATDALRKTARDALDRVLGKNSEVSELWEDSEDAEKWRKSVEGLKARL